MYAAAPFWYIYKLTEWWIVEERINRNSNVLRAPHKRVEVPAKLQRE